MAHFLASLRNARGGRITRVSCNAYAPSKNPVVYSRSSGAGRTVYTALTKPVNGAVTVPTRGIAKGVYVVTLTDGKEFAYTGSVALVR